MPRHRAYPPAAVQRRNLDRTTIVACATFLTLALIVGWLLAGGSVPTGSCYTTRTYGTPWC